MTIFKTDSQPLHNTMKQQSMQIKNNRLTLLLSPQLRHLNQVQTNKEDAKQLDDSPPLRTAIRFATPTPTSLANFQMFDSSPTQFDNIMEISRTLKSKQQLKLENCIEQTPVLKWSRSVGEISSDYTIQYSAEKSQHDDENLNVTSVRSSKLLKMSTNMNYLSPSKYTNYANEHLEVSYSTFVSITLPVVHKDIYIIGFIMI